jgi:hypothetical protein
MNKVVLESYVRLEILWQCYPREKEKPIRGGLGNFPLTPEREAANRINEEWGEERQYLGCLLELPDTMR